jgi:hypothetical protein
MTSDLFSGDAGDVTHPWRRAKRTVGEAAFSAIGLALLTGPRVDRLARKLPRRRVLVTSVYRSGSLLAGALPRLASERHDVTLALGAVEAAEPALAEHTVAERLGGGKFENLNRVLEAVRAEAAAGASGSASAASGSLSGPSGSASAASDPLSGPSGSASAASDPTSEGSASAAARTKGVIPEGREALDFDWILAVDDDLALPPRFLDRFVALCEHFALDLAQPAQTLRSHSAWRVTRRRPASLVRETRFVEIGPLTAFGRRAAPELLPFPELRYGWGLDLHWAALAEQRGWRLGVVDATPVRHESATVGSAYPRAEAEAEATDFLASRPHLPASRAGELVAAHRRVGR